MKLLLLALTSSLAFTHVKGDSTGMSYGGPDTCLDPLALKDRFLPNSALLSDVEDALGACISVNERAAKKKKTASKKKVSKKEEEKPSKKSSSKKGKANEEDETPKKKSTSKSKKSSSKDDEPSKKSSKKSTSKGGKGAEEEETQGKKKTSKKSPSKGGKGSEEETQGKKKTSKKEEPSKKSSKKSPSKGGKGSEEETQGKKKTSKKEEPSKKGSKKSTSKKGGSKKQPKGPSPQPSRPEPPQCQTFEEIVDLYDDIVCVMEFLGWSDVNGTLNETMIYNDVLTEPLLILFYDDIYGACLNESDGQRTIETEVETRCIPSFTGQELLQLNDLMETTQAFLCWDSFVNKALLTWSKMVLGTPNPVIDVFGTPPGN